MRKIITYFIAVIFFVTTVLTGCGQNPQTKPKLDEGNNKVKIAVSSADTKGDDYQILKMMVDKQAKEKKMEILWLDAQNNSSLQQENIQKAVKEKVKVLVIEPVETSEITKSLEALQSQGIKVICYNKLPQDFASEAYLAPDYERTGEIQAQQMLESLAGKDVGEVLIITGPQDNPVFRDLLQGNLNILKHDKRVGKVTVEELEKESSVGDTVNKYLAKTPAPQAILCHAAESTTEVINKVKESKDKDKIKTFGVATELQALDALKKKEHTGEIDMRPDLLAKLLVQTAEDLSKDEPWDYEQQITNGVQEVPVRFIPVRSITKDNISLLDERIKMLEEKQAKDGKENQKGSEGEEKQDNKDNPGDKEAGKNEDEKKTVVKIKTKDGQEFEMNIKGEIESIEMKKGEGAEEEDKKEGGDGEEGKSEEG